MPAAACAKRSSDDGAKTVFTRAGAPPDTGASTNLDEPQNSPQAVTDGGRSPTGCRSPASWGWRSTTAAFPVDEGALQWRVRWRCEAGAFSIGGINMRSRAAPEAGRVTASPEDGTGLSADNGRISLRVAAAGPWKVDVEQQDDRPLIELAPPWMDRAEVLTSATTNNLDFVGEGAARIYRLPDGSRLLRLKNFFVTANVDLEIRLSEAPAPRTTAEVVAAPFKLVAPLKATVGSMNYSVPAEIDLERYRPVIIWSGNHQERLRRRPAGPLSQYPPTNGRLLMRRTYSLAPIPILVLPCLLLAATTSVWACVPQPRLVYLEPSAFGMAESRVTVNGLGFDPGRAEVRWNAPDGALLGSAIGPNFSLPVMIPRVPDGLYSVVVISREPGGGIGNTGTAAFQVASASPSPRDPGGPAGTSVTSTPKPGSRSWALSVVRWAGGAAALVFAGVLVGAWISRRSPST